MNAYVVDRKTLEQNIQVLREKAGDTPIYGVIKGNGYGLGLIPMAQVLREGGIDRFAVTGLKEVCALREAGFAEEEILMMRATCIPEELEVLLEQNATATVGSLECAVAMNQVAERMGKPFLCHLKIDTGMGRYGFLPDQLEDMQKVYGLPHLQVRGIYTHFHSAFSSEQDTRAQFAAFTGVLDKLGAAGYDLGTRHCCNSSAFLKYPEMYLDGVRLGSALLGRLSFPGDMGLQKIGWCQSQVELIREASQGPYGGLRRSLESKTSHKDRGMRRGLFSWVWRGKGQRFVPVPGLPAGWP